MVAELRELRGIPAAIQETFDDQRSEAKGSEPAPERMLTLSQWKALQETNKKEHSLPVTPVKKTGLFTAACEKVRLNPRQILASSPKQASTATSVSSGRAGVFAAISSSLSEADQVTQRPLSSGFTVPTYQPRLGECRDLQQCHVRRCTLTARKNKGQLCLLPCC